MRSTVLIAATAITFIFLPPAISQHKAGQPSDMHGTHSSQEMTGHGSMHSMQSSPGAAKAAFDHQFLDTMVVHHQSAIEMAQLVEERSAHKELKQMAQKMIDDQRREIQQMEEWKQKWYADKGDAVNMSMPGMAESMKDMSMDALRSATGETFDAMFIDMMGRHHDGAIKMAQDAVSKATHPEIMKLANDIIREQKREVSQMAKWKKDWQLADK